MATSQVTTYSGVHSQLRRVRGSATGYVCPCGKRATEWSYTFDDPCPNEMVNALGQKFSADLQRYRPMCFRCHRVYDKSAIEKCPKGHPYAGDNLFFDQGKRKCRTCVNARNRDRQARVGLTLEQRARKTELQRIRRARAVEPVTTVSDDTKSAHRSRVTDEPVEE